MSEESIFINRELSWLDFNRRVLVLGKDKNVPLAEQLKFLAIYGSNLDEFFMVRVGSLQERANLMRGKKEKRENKTNMTAEEQLAAIMPKTAQLQEDCDKYYAKALENLAACGYRKVDFDKLSKEDEHFWKKYFQSELFPILSPQIVDSRHSFVMSCLFISQHLSKNCLLPYLPNSASQNERSASTVSIILFIRGKSLFV